MPLHADCKIARRNFFAGDLLSVGDVVARPVSAQCGAIERQDLSVVVFPLTGLFAKHDGPRRHVVATPSHAILIPANHPYRISYPGAVGDHCLTMRFSAEKIASLLPRWIAASRDRRRITFSRLLPPALLLARALLFRKFADGYWDPLEVEEESMKLLVSTLSEQRISRLFDRRQRTIELVKEVVSKRPEEKWTLDLLAEIANVSPYHLAHVFRDSVGVSLYAYVLRSRLAKALDAVLDDDTSLTTIALQAGFASHSHFTVRFRELFGITPTELRRVANRRMAIQLRENVSARGMKVN